MELDKKIKVKKIFDCFSDFEEVKKYFNKAVYCADFIENFSNLERYTNTFIFKEFYQQECKPFVCSGQQYRFILPSEFVEREKQYRALTIDEFLDRFDIGEVIVFRSKVMPNIVCHVLFDGYTETDKETFVILGLHHYSLKELFSNYEFDNGDNWFPFGVEQ